MNIYKLLISLARYIDNKCVCNQHCHIQRGIYNSNDNTIEGCNAITLPENTLNAKE